MSSQQTPDITANSVLLLLRISKLGNRRKVNPGLVQVDADREAITVGKELLDCDEYREIVGFDGSVRRWLYSRSLPAYGVLKDGAYRLPLGLVEEVDDKLREFQEQRELRIQAFLDVYPAKVEQARSRLRALYNPADYPDVGQVRQAFSLEYRYLTMNVPDSLGALYQRERNKAMADVQSEVEEIKLALRMSFAGLVDHAAERLQSGTDGKKMVFRDTLVKNLEDFFSYFGARNIVNDTELATMVEQARSVIHGVDAQDLRDDEVLRRHVQSTMAGIRKAMDDGVMLRPNRRFTVEEAA